MRAEVIHVGFCNKGMVEFMKAILLNPT